MFRIVLSLISKPQAVRLNKDVAVLKEVREVTALRDGPRRVIVPSIAVWDNFFTAPGFDLGERNQPPMQEREAFSVLTYTLGAKLCAS